MRSPKVAMIASVGGSVWAAVLTVLTTPLFVTMFGIETYGLIGSLALLQILCSLLDFGAGATFTRELARSAAQTANGPRMAALARSLETMAALTGCAVGVLAFVLAPFAAQWWVKPQTLTQPDIVMALRLTALAIAMQFSANIYTAGLAGQQRLTALAALSIPFTALRTIGILGVLWLIGPRLDLYFVLVATLMLLQVLIMRHLFWQGMASHKAAPRFDLSQVRPFLALAVGTSAVSLTGTILTQGDKLIASTILPLDQFGYYMLATALAGGILLVIGPIAGTTFPRLASFASASDPTDLAGVYHTATQLAVVASVPIATVLALFPEQVLFAWTGSDAVAAHSQGVLRILAMANGIGGILSLLFGLELAQGRTAPAIWSHVISILVLLPMTAYLASHYGAAGAASAWLLHIIGMLVFRPPFSHTQLPARDGRLWYLEDTGPAVLGVLAGGVLLRAAAVLPHNRLALLLVLAMLWLVLVAIAIVCCARIREVALQLCRRTLAWQQRL